MRFGGRSACALAALGLLELELELELLPLLFAVLLCAAIDT